ncbi:hypothetical protein L208DRAFT_1339192 [Tricholoma matsutake]|nr:hypothetical protein L208DRAFT_1339192 [Tricholoma matsutake 945]
MHTNKCQDYISQAYRMVPGNFDWFLHTMLFYHTKHVIEKQNSKKRGDQDSNDSDSSDSDSDD